MLNDFDSVRLADGEYGVILELLDEEDDVYLVEILDENDTSGIPLDMGCPVHLSEIKALLVTENGITTENPLDTFGKNVPSVNYRDIMDLTNH